MQTEICLLKRDVLIMIPISLPQIILLRILRFSSLMVLYIILIGFYKTTLNIRVVNGILAGIRKEVLPLEHLH